MKKALFVLLECVYVTSIENIKSGGFKCLLETDEALLGKKPTYGHGNINKVFKIWVVGMMVRPIGNRVPDCVLIPVVNRNAKTLRFYL